MAKPQKPVEHLVGYVRVSTEEQSFEMQRVALLKEGVAEEDIYSDKKSGATMEKRPGLLAALKACRPPEHSYPGSILVVWKLDRVSRNMTEMMNLADQLNERGVELRSVTERTDTRTPEGWLMFAMLVVMAEFERRIGNQRTRSGLAVARAMGRIGGAPRQFDEDKERAIAQAFWVRPKGQHRSDNAQAELVAKRFKITAQSVWNIRDRYPDEKPAGAPEPKTKLWRANVERLNKAAKASKRQRTKALKIATVALVRGMLDD